MRRVLNGVTWETDSMGMASTVAHGRASDGLRLVRYLPLAVALTLAVIALPLLAVAQLGPARGPLAVALHVGAAVVLSVALARGLALLWTRHGHSSDLVFGDLLLWGWVRRFWAERRLEETSRRLAEGPVPGQDRAALLRRLSELLERRDPYTHGHSRRVARHSERIARGMGLSREQVERIRAAALVHDIGKINIPRSILTKPGRLTDAEFALVKRHPGDGAVMVSELDDAELASIVRHHHERLDGAGYPDALAGHDIPLGARIIAVADTFDAITSARPYRSRRTHQQALEVVRREAGGQLDPDAVAAFGAYYAGRRSVGWAAAVLAVPQRLVSGLGGVQSGLAAGAAPLAQTACGVGAAAVIGACLAGPALPEPSGDRSAGVTVAAAAPEESPGRQAGSAGERGPAGNDGPAERDARRGPRRGTPEVGPGRRGPRERVPPEAPPSAAPRGGGTQQGAGSNSPDGRAGLPTPELPVTVLDPEEALDPVTEALPPAAGDALPPQLPQLRLPQLQVPQLQVPQVQLPRLR